MKVFLIASEMYPLAKIGGLGDVIGIMAKKLRKLGCDVRVVIPCYRQVKNNLSKLGITTNNLADNFVVEIGGSAYEGNIREISLDEVKVYLILNDTFYDRDYIYNMPDGDYEDDDVRFGFLSLGALEIARIVNFKPDIIHCHDWHTALVPISLKWRHGLKDDSFFAESKLVFTIHNISYQGLFGKELLNKFHLPDSLFRHEDLEYYGKVNLLKGGMLYSNLVTTVSPTHAEELKKPQYGCGLDGVLRSISAEPGRFTGILNELDHEVWDPKRDDSIYVKYDHGHLDSRNKNTLGLKLELGLDLTSNKPLIGMVARLTEQKGIDLVLESLKQILELGFQLVILGSGEARYERMLELAKQNYRGNFSVVLRPNEPIVRKTYAGSDIFLMPSRFEPCGLGQMIALKYGSIPVVRGTGGLLDTVIDYKLNKKNGNGFLFSEFSKLSLLDALIRAMYVYRNQDEWQKLVKKVMTKQFLRLKSSEIYLENYKRLQIAKR